jgi:hypothetical protein
MSQIGKDHGFAIGQRVTLSEPGIKAIVTQILFNADGVQYQVAYWDDSVRRTEWVFASEIESIKAPTPIEKT